MNEEEKKVEEEAKVEGEKAEDIPRYLLKIVSMAIITLFIIFTVMSSALVGEKSNIDKSSLLGAVEVEKSIDNITLKVSNYVKHIDVNGKREWKVEFKGLREGVIVCKIPEEEWDLEDIPVDIELDASVSYQTIVNNPTYKEIIGLEWIYEDYVEKIPEFNKDGDEISLKKRYVIDWIDSQVGLLNNMSAFIINLWLSVLILYIIATNFIKIEIVRGDRQ